MTNSKSRYQDLVSYYQSGKYELLRKKALEFINDFPDHYNGLIILGISYRQLKENLKAIEIYRDLINRFPNNSAAYTNLANIFLDMGELDNSIEYYRKSIKIKDNDCNPFDGLGLAYTGKGNLEKACEYYKKAVEINPSFERAHLNLGDNYRKRGMYKDAIKHYELTNYKLSKSQKLECHYHLNEIDGFYEELNKLAKQDKLNSLAACLSTHASQRFGVDNIYPFCKNPIDFVYHESLLNEDDFDEDFITNFLEYISINKPDFMSQNLLNKGLQSAGNLFLKDDIVIRKLKKIVNKKVDDYKEKYSASIEGVIKRWPMSYDLYGWVIEIEKEGNLDPHIHKEGWISGSIYMNLPENEGTDEGKLKVGLHGANYPDDGKIYQNKIIPIRTGDVVIFPSSLFHETIPFKINEKRVSFAFDLMPK